jgi:hypothetical protein
MRSWDKPGGDLLTAPAASGVKRARARFRLLRGTGEPVVLESKRGNARVEGVPQAAETARGRVPGQGTGADRPVVVMKLL